ncbi:MAG TPA: glycosyltransferase family 9 protein [Chryseolinea sp.]|nr:glycosyltransferase family 9 protein [Chryseolinea sp.]
MKVLIICGSPLADVVFATPIIRALKVQLEDVELHAFVELSAGFVLDDNPYVDNIHYVNPSLWKNYKRLKGEKFDLIVNLKQGWQARFLTSLLRVKTYSLKSLWWQEWLMVNFKIDQLPNDHLVNRMMKAVEPLDIKTDELGLDYFIPEKDKVLLGWLPKGFQQGYVVFCINAPYSTRKLTLDRMIELCDKINKPIILLGFNDDAQNGEVISDFFSKAVSLHYEEGLLQLNKRTIVYNACAKFNFNQMASVIKQARVVFTFDNEFIPIASAFKKEIFGLWGNTVLLFGKYPYRTKFTVLENNKVSCRPCSSTGFEKCPQGHFKCMKRIVFDFYLP